MAMLPGVYQGKLKSGSTYYRASITHRNKHISLGSFNIEEDAHQAYLESRKILIGVLTLEDYAPSSYLSFEKWVVLLNYRDHNFYIKNPIYLQKNYFEYHFEPGHFFKFDVDDLFYYSTHKIMRRGGHLFVQDYGMQINILSRFGIKNFAVPERDYRFANGDSTDYRYTNIEVINKYYGVEKVIIKGFPMYTTKIHIRGDYIVGRYHTEVEAAIAYNKAAELLWSKGLNRNFTLNYIVEVDEIGYASIYNKIRLSRKIREYTIEN